MGIWAMYNIDGMIDVNVGSQSTLHCCLSDDIKNHNGKFFCQAMYRVEGIDPVISAGGFPIEHPAEARGVFTDETAKDLFEVTEKQLNEWEPSMMTNVINKVFRG